MGRRVAEGGTQEEALIIFEEEGSRFVEFAMELISVAAVVVGS